MFIEKLEYLMKRNNISTLKELSKKTNIPYTTLRGFYDKGNDIRKSTLKKLCTFFKCSSEYFTNDEIKKEDIIFSFIQYNNDSEYENIRRQIELINNIQSIDSDKYCFNVCSDKNDIDLIKDKIKNLSNELMSEENKKSLIDMVDYFHNLAVKEKDK